MKTKYPIKVGSVLIAKGTRVAFPDPEHLKFFWPNIPLNPDSNQVAVMFGGHPFITIVDKSQIDYGQ